MYGSIRVYTLLGQTLWRTDDMRDAFDTARGLAHAFDLIVVTNEATSYTVYIWHGVVSQFIRDGVEWVRGK